jgi:hypothetical protein
VGGEQVGLQGRPGDGGSGCRMAGRLGLAGVDLAEKVAVPVEEGAVDPGASATPPESRGCAALLPCAVPKLVHGC